MYYVDLGEWQPTFAMTIVSVGCLWYGTSPFSTLGVLVACWFIYPGWRSEGESWWSFFFYLLLMTWYSGESMYQVNHLMPAFVVAVAGLAHECRREHSRALLHTHPHPWPHPHVQMQN